MCRKVERMRRLSQQYPWTWIILPRVSCRVLLPKNVISQKYKNENVNSLETSPNIYAPQSYRSYRKHLREVYSINCVINL